MPTVNIEGKEHTVSLDAIKLDEGHRIVSAQDLERDYIPREKTQGDDAEYVLAASMRQRYKNYVHRQKALEDEKIVQAVLDKHAEPLKSESLEEAKKQWDKAHAEPLRAERDQAVQNLTDFRAKLIRESVQAGASGVWDDQFTKAPKGRKSYIASQIEGDFDYCDDYGYVAARRRGTTGEWEFVPSNNPTAERPFMDAAEYQRYLATQDDWKAFAKNERITTPPGGAPRGDRAGQSTLRRSDMTAKEKAAYVNEHGKEEYLALPA